MTYVRYTPGLNSASPEHRQIFSELPFFPNMTNFIGIKEQDIIDTIQYYNKERNFSIELPFENSSMTIEKIVIPCNFSSMIQKHTLTIHPLPDVELIVNANRFHDIQEQAFLYRTKRRGALYKLVTDPNTLFYLPETVMQAMADYDWKQHEAQVKEWNRELDHAYRQMEEGPGGDLGKMVREHDADGVVRSEDGLIIVKKKRNLH